MLRITTTKKLDEMFYELKEKDDENTELKIENNELKKAINGAYNRLHNYTVTTLCDYRTIIREAKNILEDKVEKKFADEILPHYTSTNQ